MSFFETIVAMAYAAFADAPVDAAVVEVGMGGAWDATNVIDAKVAVLTPIAVDHARYLGETPAEIAAEKVGIIKPGAVAVTAVQSDDVAQVLVERCAEVGATLVREGIEFGVTSRTPAVGGQVIGLQGLRGTYEELFVPLYGAHQAQNAALALAAVEAFVGGEEPLDAEVVAEAFAEVTSPGRLEIIRRSPTVLLDAAHNPHGAAALVDALEDSFAFSALVGVVSVMADKDVEGLLSELEPVLVHVVCTQNSTGRSLPADELAEVARGIFGTDRVSETTSLADAIDQAAALAEAGEAVGQAIGSGGVLVTGSVVTVGEARRDAALAPREEPRRRARGALMQRRLCSAILVLEAIVLALTIPVLFSLTDIGTATVLVIGGGLTVAALVVAGLLRFQLAFWLGWAIQVAAIAVGFVVPTMFFLGAIFLALWATAYLLGHRIEVERAEWERTGQYPGAS